MGQKQKIQFDTETLVNWIKRVDNKNAGIASPEVVTHFGVSRSTAARVLKKAVDEGRLNRTGSTKSATYTVKAVGKTRKTTQQQIHFVRKLQGLSEDEVFEKMSLMLNLKSALSENAYKIAQYAFTEMLNNAIDHSKSQSAIVDGLVKNGVFSFQIRDRGIGIYKKIRQTFNLESNEAAVEHLLKGKQTTAPEAHSGQGIFFTSKIADVFAIKSETFHLTIDNETDDQRLGVIRKIIGTEVSFRIKSQTRKSLERLFNEYANDDFEFDRSKYPIRILTQTGSVSRSQAKRLTFGLEKFDRIIFDFSGVQELGQGFADELFRIFQKRHPNMVLEVRGANAAVDLMIRRARSKKD